MKYFFIVLISIFIAGTQSCDAQKLSSHSRKAAKLYEEAHSHLTFGHYHEADESLQKAVKIDPSFYEAYLLLGDLHADLNENDMAIRYYNKSIELNADFYPPAHYYVGKLYIGEGDYIEAEKAFKHFLTYQKIDDYSKQDAERNILNCQFALTALQNPVEFTPHNMGKSINSVYSEYFPTMNVEGNFLLYTRRLGNEGQHQQEDFYASMTNNSGKWVNAQNLGSSINTQFNEGAASISADGQTIIFTACEQNGIYGNGRSGYGSCDLFFTHKQGNRWSQAQNLGKPINTASWESQPSLSSDGETLYFVRGIYRGQQRESDIMVSHLDKDGYWTSPKKLPKCINTIEAEESVFIHPDNQTLYFSSRGHIGMGGSDIYMSKLDENGLWDSAINIGYPINTYKDENSLLVGPEGNIGYFASDRDGGFGELDLYAFNMPEEIKAEPVTFFKGVVYDSLSRQLLAAQLELIDLETSEVLKKTFSNSKNGAFFLTLSPNHNYIINASKNGYLFYSDAFFIKEGHTQLEAFVKNVPLLPIEVGNSIVLKNIFFETDQSDLMIESRTELKKLQAFLISNPSISIEISGHTDNVGSYKYNKELSENRAKAVYDFLLNNKIEKSRLSYKGYSFDQPVDSNETEKGRAKNRRTAFVITGI